MVRSIFRLHQERVFGLARLLACIDPMFKIAWRGGTCVTRRGNRNTWLSDFPQLFSYSPEQSGQAERSDSCFQAMAWIAGLNTSLAEQSHSTRPTCAQMILLAPNFEWMSLFLPSLSQPQHQVRHFKENYSRISKTTHIRTGSVRMKPLVAQH